jgi:hypothetical protein
MDNMTIITICVVLITLAVFFGAANVLGAIVGATKLAFSLAFFSALLFGGYALFMWRAEQMAHPHYEQTTAPQPQPPLLSEPRQHTQDTSGQQAPTSQRLLTDEEVGLCGTATTPACENGFAVAPGHHAWEYDRIIKCPDNRTAPVQLNSGIWVCR